MEDTSQYGVRKKTMSKGLGGACVEREVTATWTVFGGMRLSGTGQMEMNPHDYLPRGWEVNPPTPREAAARQGWGPR
ncbi:hypothetical protein VULLAG_LOCUS13898 [Vulpes lagopus]